jgi:hypothetical protein
MFILFPVSFQMTYLGNLLDKRIQASKSGEDKKTSSSSDSDVENNALELLLSRFTTFGSGCLLMDELEGKSKGVSDPKKSEEAVKKVFQLLLNVVVVETNDALKAAMSAHNNRDQKQKEEKDEKDEKSSSVSAPSVQRVSGALAILQNMQKQLLARAGMWIIRTPEEEEQMAQNGMTEAEPWRTAYEALLQYSLQLLESCTPIVVEVTKVVNKELRNAKNVDVNLLRALSSNVLNQGLVGQLARPLCSALVMFANPKNIDMSLRLLPAFTSLTSEVDRLLVAMSEVPRWDQPVATTKVRTFESSHPYSKNINKTSSVTVNGARSLSIQFDYEKCNTESEQDYVQLFTDSAKKNELTPKLFGPPNSSKTEETSKGNWPTAVLRMKGNTVHINTVTSAYGVGWGWRLTISGVVMEPPLLWLQDFAKTIASCTGAVAAPLIAGPPAGPQETKSKSWLSSVLCQGGLENDHPKAPCLLPQIEALDLKLPALSVLPSDKKEQDAFLKEVCDNEKRGAELVDLCTKHGQRFGMLIPSLKVRAIKAAASVFAAKKTKNEEEEEEEEGDE